MVQFEEASLGWPWLSSSLLASVRIDRLQGHSTSYRDRQGQDV
jgi:hypothetical protein